MRPWLVVSFAAGAKGYHDQIRKMEQSCRKFKVAHDISILPLRHPWTVLTKYVPTFLGDMLRKWPEHNIVWLDSDARVRQHPSLFDALDCGMAAFWLHGKMVTPGVLFLCNCPETQAFLSAWAAECQKPEHKLVGNMWAFNRVLHFNPGKWKILPLPDCYNHLYDSKDRTPPVIEHSLVSRKIYWNRKKRIEARKSRRGLDISRAIESRVT